MWIAVPLVLACAGALSAQSASPAEPTANSTPLQHQKPHLPIQAKTHEEYVAYQAAIANKQDAEAMAKAAANPEPEHKQWPVETALANRRAAERANRAPRRLA